jgi:beta-lactamase regulating signal transducer with metallopeptidase domain
MPFDRELILRFYESVPGTYVIQGSVHSLISAIIINNIIKAFKIRSPSLLQTLHIIPVIIPTIALPLYYLLDPSRNYPEGKIKALLDIERLLAIEFQGISAGMIIILLMLVATVIFLIQELIPVIKNISQSKKEEQKRVIETHRVSFYGMSHEVNVIEDNGYIIFSSTGRRPAIFISTGLIRDLPPDEVDAAIAHEAAHIMRSRRPLLIVVYIFRVLMFFNPVTLIEFRKAVHEEEKICDMMALKEIKNPQALLSVLGRMINMNSNERLIEDSYNTLMMERIYNLNEPDTAQGYGLFTFIAIVLTVMVNYFIL